MKINAHLKAKEVMHDTWYYHENILGFKRRASVTTDISYDPKTSETRTFWELKNMRKDHLLPKGLQLRKGFSF